MRLLVAVDLLHVRSPKVVDQAAEWAVRMGARLDLAFVDEYEYSAYLIRDPHIRESVVAQWSRLEAQHKQDLQALLDRLPEAVRGAPRYLRGKAATALAEVAPEYDALVVATHGRRGLDHALMGSVAERLLRTVETPVLVLRTPAETSPAAERNP